MKREMNRERGGEKKISAEERQHQSNTHQEAEMGREMEETESLRKKRKGMLGRNQNSKGEKKSSSNRERKADMQERTKERNGGGKDCVTAAQKTAG